PPRWHCWGWRLEFGCSRALSQSFSSFFVTSFFCQPLFSWFSSFWAVSTDVWDAFNTIGKD
ncbi:MAG TPA: hypothetical protein PLF81_20540, partial [Candidatus Anammoximicrobium sp.]|nr:hypothetical protein [Candidatus Anammoximicrobium sp.]